MTFFEHNDWSRNLASMLGKEVKTTLSTHPEIVIASGTLLSFTDDGEVVIRDEGGSFTGAGPT